MTHGLSTRALFAVVSVAACAAAVAAGAQDRDPRPQAALAAVLAAFDRYDVVGMSAAHSNEKEDQFISALIHDPAFPSKVNDIVVECGNSLYQPTLDRYIAGDDVPLETVRQTWRTTSVQMCALSGFYDAFFPSVRALNVSLAKERRLRVLVTEPPIDWNASSPATTRPVDRNSTITSVMTTEVLAKHRKALVLIGVGHLFHGGADGSAVAEYERTYPGRTFVIATHSGFAAFFDLERGQDLEGRMRTWPVPSLVTLKGSWLADLDLPYFLWPFPKRMAGQSFADLVDAYLYLGPGASLTYERTPDAILNNQQYLADLSAHVGSVNVDALRRRNQDRALFTAADRAEARQFAPGAECVGIYVDTPGGAPVIEIDFRRGVLSARMGQETSWQALSQAGSRLQYTLTTSAGLLRLDFAEAGGSVERLNLDAGGSGGTRRLARSSM